MQATICQELHQRCNMPASSQNGHLNSYQLRYQRDNKDSGATTNYYKGLYDHNQDCTTPPTITVTATSAKIDTTIATDSTTTVELYTTTKVETVRITDVKSITSTSTSTTTIPFVYEAPVCTRKRARAARALPTSCSCFLTTTKSAATKTVTVTKNKPAVTHVVYKIGGPRKVIRRTITIFRYKAGPTLSAPETTKTSTTTITQTDRTLTTVTDSQTTTATEIDDIIVTITQTETESAIATATADPCDNAANQQPISQQISGTPIEVTFSTSVDGLFCKT
ncbi:hypothetical protein ACHAPA_011983 [Fusarium lateritium]